MLNHIVPYDMSADVEDLNHSMVTGGSSFAWTGCSSSIASGELAPKLCSGLTSSVMPTVSLSAILGEAWASRGSVDSGERKPVELSQWWVEEETCEMTGSWTEEEDDGVAPEQELPGYEAWVEGRGYGAGAEGPGYGVAPEGWDSSRSYCTPNTSSSSCTWLR